MNDEKKRILKLLEEGQLTAEEAAMLLEAMDGKRADQHDSNQDNAPSTNVEYSEAHSDGTYKQSSTMNRFSEFIESALQKIKDLDLDFNFGQSFEVSHIYQHKDVYLHDLDIDVANGDVKLVPWDEPDVKIECAAKVYRARSQDEARKIFMKNVDFSISGSSLRFGIKPKQMKVFTTFYLPKSDYEEVAVRMFNGGITGKNMKANAFKVKTANGNIQFDEMHCNDLELETANGHITLLNSSANECEIETLNGTIKTEGSFVKADLNSFNGNVICKLTDAKAEKLFVETTTGNIDLYLNDQLAVDGRLKSNLGGFTCEVPDITVVEEKKDVVQKSLQFKANSNNQAKLLLEAETKTGSILITNQAKTKSEASV